VVAAILAGLAFDSLAWITIAILYLLIATPAGIITILRGIGDHGRAARKLRDFDDRRKLPEARLLR
jgi:hypothetical protein